MYTPTKFALLVSTLVVFSWIAQNASAQCAPANVVQRDALLALPLLMGGLPPTRRNAVTITVCTSAPLQDRRERKTRLRDLNLLKRWR